MSLHTLYEGKCHTLKSGYDMGYGKGQGPSFVLNRRLIYFVYIYDPRFYIHAIPPLPTPGIRLELDKGSFYVNKYLSVTKHIQLNQKNNPCNEDPNYDFQLCVRNSLTSEVGCRLPWDLWSSSYFPLCSKMDQLNMFHRLYFVMSVSKELEDIIKKTGCLAPCEYKEYKIVLEPDRSYSPKNMLYLGFTDNKLIIEKELEGYSLISLVSDIGGALGLFLGFSFVMLWDGAELIIRKMRKYLRDRSVTD